MQVNQSYLKALYVRTILLNPYIPKDHKPHPKQVEFLLATDPKTGKPYEEILFGGSGGPGKSDAILMAALQYVEFPRYAALIIRKTYSDLSEPGALIDRAHEWLDGTDAKWDKQQKIWTFPGGAKLSFGYLANENDKYRYKSAEFQFVAFDELTDFERESDYTYLFSRLRGPDPEHEPDNPLAYVPWRMRAATNPGSKGHAWVKNRFQITPANRETEGRFDRYKWVETEWLDEENQETHRRLFIPAFAEDNLSRTPEQYMRSLASLDPVSRARMRKGDWEVEAGGGMFWRHWFEIIPSYDVPDNIRAVRAWDLAATEPKAGRDPDWTAGCLLGEHDGVYYLMDMRRWQMTPQKNEGAISSIARSDGKHLRIGIEEEGGASGKIASDHYKRRVLKGYPVWTPRPLTSKVTRANPVSSAAEAGNIKLVEGPWITQFLDEAEQFPLGAHKDQIDALSLAFELINRRVGTVEVMKQRMR
jgi:predicted phage terminase large subunit-like protein